MNSLKLTTLSITAAFLGGAASLIAEDATPAAETTTTTKTKIETAKPAGISSATGAEVGISSQDGISLSGKDVLVTRNGVSEKLIKPIKLENGTKVMTDGTVMVEGGEKVPLRAGQVLTFDGKIMELNAPEKENGKATTIKPKSLDTDATVVGSDKAGTTTRTKTKTVTTEEGAEAVSKDAAEKADAEVERRKAADK